MMEAWLESILKNWNSNADLDMLILKLEHYTGRKVHLLTKKKGTDDVKIVWDRD